MSESPTKPPEPPAGAQPCVFCGTALAGLGPGDRCPKCQAPVAPSLSATRLSVPRLAQLRAGITLLAAAAVIDIGSFVLVMVLVFSFGTPVVSILVFGALLAVELLEHLAWTVGVFGVTVLPPRPLRDVSHPRQALARSLATANLTSFVMLVVGALWLMTPRPEPGAMVLTVATTAAIATRTGSLWMTGRYIAGLLDFLGRPALADHTRRLTTAATAVLALQTIAVVPFALYYVNLTAAPVPQFGALLLAVVLAVLALLGALFMGGQIRGALWEETAGRP